MATIAAIQETKSFFDNIEKIKERFFQKVAITANDNLCWNWTGWVKSKGKKCYGVFGIKLLSITAHRFAYYLFHNADPKEMHVLHTCDNPRCVNPKHLFLGTNADNVADKVSKGRQARNVCWNKGKPSPFRLWNNPQCKVTKEQFEEAKIIYEKGGITLRQLGVKYNTSKKALANAFRALGGTVTRTTFLSETQVLEIRNEYKNGKTKFVSLAQKYNVGHKTITDIIYRKTWKNI